MAMLITILVTMVCVALVGVIFANAMQAIPLATQAQNYQTALQAAQAGVSDYISHLNSSATYYTQTAYNSTNLNPALPGSPTGWQQVPGEQEWYRYAVSSANTARTGVVHLIVSGAAGQSPRVAGDRYTVRTIEESIAVAGFNSDLYATNYEIQDPNTVSNFRSSYGLTYAQECAVDASDYNQPVSGATGRAWYGPGPDCSPYFIYFGGGDVLNGKVYSNDEFHICGQVTFEQLVSSKYNTPTADSVANSEQYGGPGVYYPDAAAGQTSSCGSASPTFAAGSTEPTAPVSNMTFPTTNTYMAADTAVSQSGGGCLYSGPLSITFGGSATNPTMTVAVPTGSAVDLPAGATYSCGKAGTTATVPVPPNGLIYDEPTTTSGTNADVSVSGTVYGGITVGSQNDITVVSSLLYGSQVPSGSAANVLGLSATDYVYLPDSYTHNALVPDLTIEAAIVALNGSMYLPYFQTDGNQSPSYPSSCSQVKQSSLGKLTILGSLVQDYRGPVGQTVTYWGCNPVLTTGYVKHYSYDPNLQFDPPPYFSQPTLPSWTETGFAECTATATPTATSC